jgi:hypothetical protein
MTNRSVAIIVALALAACRGQERAQRSKPNYEVVQEDSASGVTSTINGPGETTTPATNTNVDTTTNFTLSTNPNPLGNDTASSTVLGSLPSNPIYPAAGMIPTTRRTRATDPRGMASSSSPVVTDTVGSTTPPILKETRSAPADTTSASTSDTDATTTTTADQQPPPPPPTSMDTRG